jgi:hypothetical protein
MYLEILVARTIVEIPHGALALLRRPHARPHPPSPIGARAPPCYLPAARGAAAAIRGRGEEMETGWGFGLAWGGSSAAERSREGGEGEDDRGERRGGMRERVLV